jgi:hypothetical protein
MCLKNQVFFIALKYLRNVVIKSCISCVVSKYQRNVVIRSFFPSKDQLFYLLKLRASLSENCSVHVYLLHYYYFFKTQHNNVSESRV